MSLLPGYASKLTHWAHDLPPSDGVKLSHWQMVVQMLAVTLDSSWPVFGITLFGIGNQGIFD